MNDVLENKLTMYEAMVSLLDGNTAKLAPITALTPVIADFKDRILAIKEKIRLQILLKQAKHKLKSHKAVHTHSQLLLKIFILFELKQFSIFHPGKQPNG